METHTKDVCAVAVLGFKVTSFTLANEGEITKTYYVICNQAGEVFSQKYNTVTEPLAVLGEIVEQKKIIEQRIQQRMGSDARQSSPVGSFLSHSHSSQLNYLQRLLEFHSFLPGLPATQIYLTGTNSQGMDPLGGGIQGPPGPGLAI